MCGHVASGCASRERPANPTHQRPTLLPPSPTQSKFYKRRQYHVRAAARAKHRGVQVRARARADSCTHPTPNFFRAPVTRTNAMYDSVKNGSTMLHKITRPYPAGSSRDTMSTDMGGWKGAWWNDRRNKCGFAARRLFALGASPVFCPRTSPILGSSVILPWALPQV